MSNLRYSDVSLPGGPRLRVAESGPRGGYPVLMLHGITDSSFSFSRLQPSLPPDWHLIMPDQRGHGESDRPAAGYTIDDYASDAIALLKQFGTGAAMVVGHSLGSAVAQRVAARHSGLVHRLVLIGAAYHFDLPEVRELQRQVASLESGPDEDFIRQFQASTIHAPLPEEFFENVIAESKKLPPRVWKSAFAGLAENAATDLGQIRCPTLLIYGEHDAIFPISHQHKLQDGIVLSRLEILKETGHSPHWEYPETVAQLLRDAKAMTAESLRKTAART
ncbi:MAG: alpha/beta hydrolase [Bryobacteraceae bacterium]|nr:alpha/beta hydrolase [Bryobacteraceae bacterium]